MTETYNNSFIKQRRSPPFRSDPARDINILLIGETGVGKTTFINAFANYLSYDNLDEAMNSEMQVLIPSIFTVAEMETHNLTTVSVGMADKNELCQENGQSQTQGCKSYLFAIGDRYLRLIDTPGVGDTRGVDQDNMNFGDVLTFISRYEHLNGICILLKPNDNRLTISFRYVVKEVLKHLHVNAKDNIMFVFTNARTNLYAPGATSVQLRLLLNELKDSTTHEVPFIKDNTFLFDNESFRFLAVHKAGHDFYKDYIQTFRDSWQRSVNELRRMIAKIVQCDLHAVRFMQSLNEAQQLIRKLSRPIGEVATILEENIQLAEKHKDQILANEDDITPNRLPEKRAKVVSLRHPRTICTSDQCSKVTKVGNEMKVEYTIKCHERCYLKGVEQEVINNPALKHCRAMNKITGKCVPCGCDWSAHMHVTYEFRKQLSFMELDERSSIRSQERLISRIDYRIAELRQEQEFIRYISAQLTLFLRENSINPTNEDVIEYINHFIREEKQKLNAGDDNQQIIHGLEKLIEDYKNEIALLKANVNNESGGDRQRSPTLDDIFVFKNQLCELPITGKYIQDQIDSLDLNQTDMIYEQEEYIELPPEANYSTNMQQLKKVMT